MVTAADGPSCRADMRDDEILVNQWLADDLQVKPGDSVALSYYVVDSGSRLVERTNSFPRAPDRAAQGHLRRPHADARVPGPGQSREHARLGRGLPARLPDSGKGRGLLESLPRHAQGLRHPGGGAGDVGQPVRDAHGDPV